LVLWWIIPSIVLAQDRCESYRLAVRKSHQKYLGPAYPWKFGLAQLKVESNCRNITAFDGGTGVAQFMPSTAKYVSTLMKSPFLPSNPAQAINAQAFYISHIHKKENWGHKPLWVDYQIYNGGKANLYKEYQRAEVLSHFEMRQACKRKIIQLKSGPLDLCSVNYRYSEKIYDFAKLFDKSLESMRYW
jgi:hypothetical protein